MTKVQRSILSFFRRLPASADGSRKAGNKSRTSPASDKVRRTNDSPASVDLSNEASIAALDASEARKQSSGRKKAVDNRGDDSLARRLFPNTKGTCMSTFKRDIDITESATPVSERKKRRLRVVEDDEDAEPVELFLSDVPKSTISLESDDTITVQDEDGSLKSLPGHEKLELSKYSLGSQVALNGDAKARKCLMGAFDQDEGINGSGVGPSWAKRHSWTIDIRDKKMRRPGEEGYDKTTLYVPSREFSGAKGCLTPFQKQFWKIKQDNYDVIIFFKKGKFYEMYDVDADIGHRVLNLNFTKGGRVDMRCCGVPEQAFDKHAARLIELGYKVGRVEQTETINDAQKRKAATNSSKTVCERSLVKILTKATITDENLLRDHKARYLLAIKEQVEGVVNMAAESGRAGDGEEEDDGCQVGICYVDAASGSITVGEYADDYRRSCTEKLIAYLEAPEVIVDTSSRRAMSDRFRNLVRWISDADNVEVVSRSSGFSPMTPAWLSEYLGDSDSDSRKKKNDLELFFKDHHLASQCMGAAASYLRSLRIDREVLSLGNYAILPSPYGTARESKVNNGQGEHSFFLSRPINSKKGGQQEFTSNGEADGVETYDPQKEQSSGISMDASTLTNLEVITNSWDGSARGTLLSFIDRGKTAGGRRLLRRWLSSPLLRSEAITDRLNAVESLLAIPPQTMLQCQSLLAVASDLSRALAKIHSYAVSSSRAVMFDDSHKRRVKAFVKLLHGLNSTLEAFDILREEIGGLKQPENKIPRRLSHLLAFGGGVPQNIKDRLRYFFEEAFDFSAAESDGEIHLRPGVVKTFDDALEAFENIKDDLDQELRRWKAHFGGNKEIKYYHRAKEPYQLEVPVSALHLHGVPDKFTLKSTGRGTQRYWTDSIRRLVEKYVDRKERLARESENVARTIFGQFAKDFPMWNCIASSTAEVDALISLALTSRSTSTCPMTRPEILPNSHPDPVLHVRQLRHPVLSLSNPSFIPNDTHLGKLPVNKADHPDSHMEDDMAGSETTLIITGPNMGGKSTLSRQVALCAILAQIGCFVPADHLILRPVDSIFVRMGACDRIARGRSTFMVELEETYAILTRATQRSLVILDELGRGTSTHDGYAIAYATLDYLIHIGTLVLFSTHYTRLATDFGGRPQVAAYEMKVAEDESQGEDGIVFLYRFGRGVAKYSRGITCARMAGIPRSVCAHAETMGSMMERLSQERRRENSFLKLFRTLNDDQDASEFILAAQCLNRQCNE